MKLGERMGLRLINWVVPALLRHFDLDSRLPDVLSFAIAFAPLPCNTLTMTMTPLMIKYTMSTASV